MTLLSPWTALIASAITMPLLLLLYFLRLRRQHVRIPSTLLWQKSFEDLQVNTPFQRLRWSLLLLLQLLLLLLLLAALADPVLRGRGSGSSRMVLLIDRSASMNAVVHAPADHSLNGKTRLQIAKESARAIIKRLGNAGEPAEIMIISFASSAGVVCSFESNQAVLEHALDSIEPTDEEANLDAALQLASAFAANVDENPESGLAQPEVMLLSDGGVNPPQDSNGFSLSAGKFRFLQVCPRQDKTEAHGQVGEPIDNVGIVAFSVRRDFEDPARVLVFARLINAGAAPVNLVATLLADGVPVNSIQAAVPAASASSPGEQTILQAIDLPGGAVLELRQNHHDDLAADDAAALVLPAPARPRIAQVHPDESPPDAFVHDLLEALEPQTLQTLSQSAYMALDASQINAGAMFDMVVFDRVSVSRLPAVGTLTIGGVPAPLKSKALADDDKGGSSSPQGQHILSWDRQHPVMRNVALDTIVYAGFSAYELPSNAASLALGPEGPVIAVIQARSARHVAVGFEMKKSNWPLHVSSSVFVQNVLDFLTLSDAGQNGIVHQPGQSVTVRAAADVRELVIQGPETERIAATAGAAVALPALRRAGLYKVAGAVPPGDVVAVSMLSDVESDVRPRFELKVNADSTSAIRAMAAAPEPLWPWLVAAAFALLVIEWLVYCRRVRG